MSLRGAETGGAAEGCAAKAMLEQAAAKAGKENLTIMVNDGVSGLPEHSLQRLKGALGCH